MKRIVLKSVIVVLVVSLLMICGSCNETKVDYVKIDDYKIDKIVVSYCENYEMWKAGGDSIIVSDEKNMEQLIESYKKMEPEIEARLKFLQTDEVKNPDARPMGYPRIEIEFFQNDVLILDIAMDENIYSSTTQKVGNYSYDESVNIFNGFKEIYSNLKK